MNLALKLKLLQLGISQFELSREVGISDSYLSKVINGWVRAPEELKAKIADRLGCPVEEIFIQKITEGNDLMEKIRIAGTPTGS